MPESQYQFEHQIKNVAAPAVTQGTILAADADGLVLPLMAKVNPASPILADRLFFTMPEGFINFDAAVVAIFRIAVETTHYFSEVNAQIPDLVTRDRERTLETVVGSNAIALAEFASAAKIAAADMGGALLGQRIPVSMRITVKGYGTGVNRGNRADVGYSQLEYNKVGVTFWQLKDLPTVAAANIGSDVLSQANNPNKFVAIIEAIDAALLKLAGSTKSIVEIQGDTYTIHDVRRLRELRDFYVGKLAQALARAGNRKYSVLKAVG